MLVTVTRATIAAVVTALLVGSSAIQAQATVSDRSAAVSSAAVPWTVYANETYTNVDLVAAGATQATVLGDGDINEMLGQGQMPSETEFKDLVEFWVGSRTGPVILDFETIYLRGSITRATAEARAAMWIQLLQWTREAKPGRMIGIYNFLKELDTAFMDLAEDVAAYEDAFFPSMYSYSNMQNQCSDQAGWTARLQALIARGDQIDPFQPTIPFIWPQIYPTCPGGGSFLTAAQWRYQLDTIHTAGTSGLLIYGGGNAPATSLGWYNETVDFINSL